MSVIANLESEGRVERSARRDNIHVYVFGSGRRPDEKLIASVIARKPIRECRQKITSHLSPKRDASKSFALRIKPGWWESG